jgi:NAD(P)-dependent dehydrogenase (short-subunit alcohol dehydrogenase family)
MSEGAASAVGRVQEMVGKNVFITGAEGGIGICLVEAFTAAGAVVFAASRSEHTFPQPSVTNLVLDITDSRQVADAAAAYAERTDILINNAGCNYNLRFLDVDESAAVREMEVNYFGTLRMIRAFAPAMIRRRRGTILNIASVGAHVSFPNMGSYCASKAALHLLTQSTRAELSFHGVGVVGVYPPAVDTRMSSHVAAADKIAPREVAAAILAGLSDGCEDVYIGAAADLCERVRREPKAVEIMLRARVAPTQ